ncbi:MAG TPA: M20 family metallopeptidase [Thermomicrobiales bacterium]|nr:M20 family metallopeptidase [Thermomicrobiales bacterium]
MGSESKTVSPWVDRVSRDEIVDVAQKLVSIPSVSGDEAEVMKFVQGWLDGRGMSYVVTANDPNRPNVIATVGDPSSGPVIAMNGHLDTVPVSDAGEWKTDPFEGVISEDGKRLFGRGASDMKSSVGVMMTLLDLFKDAPLKGALQAHIVSDEEVGARFGTLHVLDEIEAGNLPRPDYVFIGEGSEFKVRNAERGGLALNVRFIGRASHTAAARVNGINAIQKAAKGILALEEHLDKFHPAVGYPVISINMISGGVAHNVVPGECTISIDRRLIPGETKESVVEEIRAKLDAAGEDDPDYKYELIVDPDDGFIDANITPEDSPLVKAFQESVRVVTGNEPEYFVQWAGMTDGRFYRQHNIDTVGMGPRGEGAHGANESIAIDDLVLEGRIYAQTIATLLQVD